MIKLNRNTQCYIRIDKEEELEMLCEFINSYLPNKFRWASENNPVPIITKEYITKICNCYKETLYIGKNYSFMRTHNYLNIGDKSYAEDGLKETISIYDIDGIYNNTPNIPKWIALLK